MQPQSADTPPQRSARFWAWIFIASGLYALACFPTVLLFEHFDWSTAPLRMTSFCACVLAVVGAAMCLVRTRGGVGTATTFGMPTRALAFVAIVLAGGFVLLIVGLLVLLSFMPNEF